MRHTTIMVDDSDLKEARKLHVNLSAGFREYIRTMIYGSQAVEITPVLEREVNDFVKIAKENKKWRIFLVGRQRKIKLLTGKEIGLKQLENLVLEKLKSGGDVNGEPDNG